FIGFIRQRCDLQRSTEPASALQQRHPMSLRVEAQRRLHAAWPAADDDVTFRRGGLPLATPILEAGFWVDGATSAVAEVDGAHAGVTVDARPDRLRLAGRQLARQVWIGQQLASHADEVESAGADLLVGQLWFDAPGGDDRNRDSALDFLRRRQVPSGNMRDIGL